MKRVLTYSLSVLFALCFVQVSAATHAENDSIQQTDTFDFIECTVKDSLLEYAENFLGVRYSYGGKSAKGFDCTGFVQTVFNKFGYSTPRSSSAIRTVGKEVKRKNAEVGDIVYFTGRNSKSKRPGHVGIITEIKDGVIYFIHASVNHGISYSHTATRYYSRRFLGVRRILE